MTYCRSFGIVILSSLLAMPVCSASSARGELLSQVAEQKLDTLRALIARAEEADIDTLKDRMTVRTAELFLNYADWDETHKSINANSFKRVAQYRDQAAETADGLSDFERREVILMLDEATAILRQVMAGTVNRKPAPNVDWSEVTHDGDQLTYQGRPVFLTDWTWKPAVDQLTEYHGQQDGFFLMHPYVQDENGTISPHILQRLKNKPSGRLGFIFLNHKNVPAWAKRKFGPGFTMREDTYTAYDIDNPGARQLNRLLLSGTVPYMAGKKYSQLGYMLCNEPHFYTTDGVWATGPVSEHTLGKFRTWLSKRHQDINKLNELWKTQFTDFNEVAITTPISADLQGSPKWHDWVSFNMDRVTDWYQFLKAEIRRHDPQAKVHLKIMPNLWTENQRNHGIDMEALTRMSDIIGNDAGSSYKPMWGHCEWQNHYAFEWRGMSMAHDFYKSVSPDKIMYNTESHFLSTVRSRDLEMDPMYARATFWLAHTQGLTASQNWFWGREEDGSIKKKAGNGYGGSNNQQPRVVKEVHATILDLNAWSEQIMAIQRQRKPIRIFYSKASAINKPKHMDDIFELYESLFFEGIPLGFVTQEILTSDEPGNWDVVLVHKTQYVTAEDLKALRKYIDRGGSVIMDGVSLKKDRYSRPLEGLKVSGRVRKATSLEEMRSLALRFIDSKGNGPSVVVEETNSGETKGCTWKCIEDPSGRQLLSIVNVGKTPATLKLSLKNAKAGTSCRNLLTGQSIASTQTLKPYGVLFLEVADAEITESH